MAHRIAIATSSGKMIDLHFGQADRFLIVDVDEGGYTAVETRYVRPVCVNYDHDRHNFDTVMDLLEDCESVFVSRIGYGAAGIVARRGMRVFEAPYFIEDVLKKLVADRILARESAPQEKG